MIYMIVEYENMPLVDSAIAIETLFQGVLVYLGTRIYLYDKREGKIFIK